MSLFDVKNAPKSTLRKKPVRVRHGGCFQRMAKCENLMQIGINLWIYKNVNPLSTSLQMGDNTTCQLSKTWNICFGIFIAASQFIAPPNFDKCYLHTYSKTSLQINQFSKFSPKHHNAYSNTSVGISCCFWWSLCVGSLFSVTIYCGSYQLYSTKKTEKTQPM